jgi:hypothetical protein
MARRRTVAAQERMRLINQLARKDKKDDDFGMRDEDWDVYKAINKVKHLSLNYFYSHSHSMNAKKNDNLSCP